MKSGFVTLIGKPNAGKSTLLNTLVGAKVSIVSWRPQTTRNKITGILSTDDYQIVFFDTPGIHTPRNGLGAYMMKSVRNAAKDVDAIVYVADAGREMDRRDIDLMKKYIDDGIPVIAVINKTDEATPEKVMSEIEKLKELEGLTAVIPMSALKNRNVQPLIDELLKVIPEGQKFYPDDMITDKMERFMVAEIIREKALRFLSEEVPHGTGVEIRKFSERDNGLVDIVADIICEKQSHKGIIIGKGGAMLKKISTAARLDIEDLLDRKVFLAVYVKVQENWRDDYPTLKELGYDKKNVE